MSYHQPVLLSVAVEGLNINPNGIYVDLTFGGGGHSKEILKHITTGKLFAFDQDSDAAKQAALVSHPGFTFIEANFRYLKNYLKLYQIMQVDGVLADLGISSYQIDTRDRGFSTRLGGNLDMRMDQRQVLTAEKILNEYSEEQLHHILGLYGEVRNAKTLAAAIVKARMANPIRSIDQLKIILDGYTKSQERFKYYAQVFQALRIEVNDEMISLREMLQQLPSLIKKGGRLVVISYHSLEDRIVKNMINKGNVDGQLEKDIIYGHVAKPFRAITPRPLTPSVEEIEKNNRSRSAKLRIAEKIEYESRR